MARVLKRRRRDGRIVATLPLPFVTVIDDVVGDLSAVVREPPAGPVGDRLYPRAYLDPTEEAAEQDWQSVVHDDMVQARLEAIAVVRKALASARNAARDPAEIVLDPADETVWLTVLNDARLLIGTALEVTEEEPLDFPDDDPRAPHAYVYTLLTELQAGLVDLVLAAIPEAGTD